MQPHYQQRGRLRRVAGIITIVVVIGAVLVIDHFKKAASAVANVVTPSVTTVSTPTPASSGTPSANSSGYQDGTYTTSVKYSVPHGFESIKVSLTLSNGVVTNSQIVNSEQDPTSADFQEAFASEYKSRVVGQSISSLSVAAIAGASDTAEGFNAAAQSIRAQAKA